MGIRRWRFWATTAERTKLNDYEEEILNFTVATKEMQLKLENLRLELEQRSSRHQMEMNKERAAFDLEKAKIYEETGREKRNIQAEYDLKFKEAEAVLVHKIQKVGMEAKEKLQSALNQNKFELLAEREKWMTESYEKLSGSMTKLHEEGNAQTKFVQEMAVTLLGQSPKINRLDIGVGQPREMTEVNINDNRKES